MMLLQVAAETAGITAQTWFITGLGFGMVVLLLFAFASRLWLREIGSLRSRNWFHVYYVEDHFSL